MKYSISFLSILLFLIIPLHTYAASISPTAAVSASASPSSAATNAIDQQIDLLREKIASRVAQLNLVSKRGIIGTVTQTTTSEITVNDLQNNTRFIDVDELTKFSNPDAKGTFGISDITKGMVIGVLGLYNKDSGKLLARFVDVLTLPQTINGYVISIDKKNYYVHIATAKQNDLPIDIENFTKTYSYTKENGMVRSGFSKIQVNQRVVIVGSPDVHNTAQIIGQRIIILPDLPPDPHFVTTRAVSPSPVASVTQGITPSTGNGKKLIPIIKTK